MASSKGIRQELKNSHKLFTKNCEIQGRQGVNAANVTLPEKLENFRSSIILFQKDRTRVLVKVLKIVTNSIILLTFHQNL